MGGVGVYREITEVNVQFNILGPLEVVDQGRVVPLGGVKQRAMLGMLLLRANRVVPSSKLLDSLWVGGVPPTARKMLQNAASALRDVLACDGTRAVPRTPGGAADARAVPVRTSA